MANEVSFELTGKDERLIRALQNVTAGLEENERAMRRLGGTSAQVHRQAVADTETWRDSFGSIGGAITAVNQGLELVGKAVHPIVEMHERWLAATRELAAKSSEAAASVVALADLQTGGQKQAVVEHALQLGREGGITDVGTAFNVYQSMQSAYGTPEATDAAVRNVYRMRQLGIDVQDAVDVERFNASLNMPAGTLGNMAYIAGQESTLDPKSLVRAVPALQFFEDKAFGTAVATALSNLANPDELRTLTERAGQALTDADRRVFAGISEADRKSLGGDPATLRLRMDLAKLEGASQEAKLWGLRAAGVDTEQELVDAGFSEKIERRALLTLLNQPDVLRKAKTAIEGGAGDPNLLRSRRDEIESELPTVLMGRYLEQVQAERAAQDSGLRSRADTERNIRAMAAELDRRVKGLVATDLGWGNSESPLDVVGNDGTMSPYQEFWFRGMSALRAGPLGRSDADRFDVRVRQYYERNFGAKGPEELVEKSQTPEGVRELIEVVRGVERWTQEMAKNTRGGPTQPAATLGKPAAPQPAVVGPRPVDN